MRTRKAGLIAASLAALGLMAMAPAAGAQTGGSAVPGSTPAPAPTTPTTPAPAPTGPVGKATLLSNGMAVAPSGAPPQVVNAIAAANQIRLKPYVYGGGHNSTFTGNGYDCSGAVSFALKGAGLLTSPLPSGSLMKWGLPGRGRWISVYAHRSHTYAVIAGLRWDTSAMGSGSGKGPRWRATKRKPRGFTVRHVDGL